MSTAKKTKASFATRLGRRIAKERERLGITAQELAQRADVSPQVLSEYQAGKRQPTAERLYRIAAALGVTADNLKP